MGAYLGFLNPTQALSRTLLRIFDPNDADPVPDPDPGPDPDPSGLNSPAVKSRGRDTCDERCFQSCYRHLHCMNLLQKAVHRVKLWALDDDAPKKQMTAEICAFINAKVNADPCAVTNVKAVAKKARSTAQTQPDMVQRTQHMSSNEDQTAMAPQNPECHCVHHATPRVAPWPIRPGPQATPPRTAEGRDVHEVNSDSNQLEFVSNQSYY